MEIRSYCLYLHRCLLAELATIQKYHLPEAEKIEKSFHRCVHYWLCVVKRVQKRPIMKEAEVEFFKQLKPLFTAETEYYGLLFHAALFKPLDAVFLRDFWLKELIRIDQLLNKNSTFYFYYKSGDTSLDDAFFNGANSSLDNFMMVCSHAGPIIHYDLLISQYIALERYQAYVREQLKV